MESTDVVIIGAGPIGLEMAAALMRARIDYVHFDAKQIGYTISWFAPQTRFFSSNERIAIAGVPLHTSDGSKSTREEYLNYLRTVVELFDLKVRTYEPVQQITREDKSFIVTTPRSRVRCNRLILATGGTDRPRRLGIPGEDLPHVSHYFRDPHAFFRKSLLIVGGKNSAVEAALRCHHAGANVSISYRRTQLPSTSIKYWLMPEITGLIESKRIPAYFSTTPTRITDRSVALSDGREIPADFVLLLTGYEADMSLCKLAGVELEGPCLAPKHNPKTMETNLSSLYIAGTAVGGTQDKYALFIENCHAHVDRILAALTGEKVAEHPTDFARPES
jgi:thioredoxin reductase (NADPH)